MKAVSNTDVIFICGIDTRIAKQFIKAHYMGIDENFAINTYDSKQHPLQEQLKKLRRKLDTTLPGSDRAKELSRQLDMLPVSGFRPGS